MKNRFDIEEAINSVWSTTDDIENLLKEREMGKIDESVLLDGIRSVNGFMNIRFRHLWNTFSEVVVDNSFKPTNINGKIEYDNSSDETSFEEETKNVEVCTTHVSCKHMGDENFDVFLYEWPNREGYSIISSTIHREPTPFLDLTFGELKCLYALFGSNFRVEKLKNHCCFSSEQRTMILSTQEDGDICVQIMDSVDNLTPEMKHIVQEAKLPRIVAEMLKVMFKDVIFGMLNDSSID